MFTKIMLRKVQQTAETQARGGLSERGRAVVREMNRVGLYVTCSYFGSRMPLTNNPKNSRYISQQRGSAVAGFGY
ncbi:hypothetical protein B0T26DRAFT_440336 [Lasiosphaeria miniovina]|uniref:Uncharacterized protein n=1 Tax=Lasiosphaeria miniovina TaxID=1954250 RepID=A0AA39ZYJ8_9PEZI|nr:uncharacterized protein B0T26DRAFT_440336 [Lasiosphaeria miniovina]KAK0706002.1 hypothetical protein B0T26DRAFT_440336 [Lasiosphaeria miniovina]